MPPWSRRHTRPFVFLPAGGGVIVSVHSTALPPWSSVPHGEQVLADTCGGHQLGAGSEPWKIERGWVVALVTSPFVGLSVACTGASASPWPKTPGLVGYFQ